MGCRHGARVEADARSRHLALPVVGCHTRRTAAVARGRVGLLLGPGRGGDALCLRALLGKPPSCPRQSSCSRQRAADVFSALAGPGIGRSGVHEARVSSASAGIKKEPHVVSLQLLSDRTPRPSLHSRSAWALSPLLSMRTAAPHHSWRISIFRDDVVLRTSRRGATQNRFCHLFTWDAVTSSRSGVRPKQRPRGRVNFKK